MDITTSVPGGSPTAAYIVRITEQTGNQNGKIFAAVGGVHTVEQNLSARVQFFSTMGTPPNCLQNNLLCTLQVNFNTTATNATPLTGTTTDTPVHSPGDEVSDLGGTGLYQRDFPLACNLPFGALAATNPVLSGMDLEV